MTNDAYDITFADGYVTPGRRKNNWLGSNTPTSAHGSNFRFEVGSEWVFGSNIWVCTDASTGTAVWTQIDGAGGGSGFANPMTSVGDIIRGGSSGAATRLPIGTTGQVLKVASGIPAWSDDDDSLHTDLSVGGATNVDHADGATHDLTLTGNATLTMVGAKTGLATDWRLIIRQDGTGSRTITWADTITWAGGSAPTLQTAANAVDTIGITTVDDGTTYFGYHASSSSVGALGDLSDVTITAEATGDFLRYSGSAWVDATITEPDVPVLTSAKYPFHDEVLTDGSSNIIYAGGDVVMVTGVPN